MWEQRNGEKGRNSFKVLPHGGTFKVFLPYCAIREKAFSWEDHRSETKELPRRQNALPSLSPLPPFASPPPSPSPPPSQNGTPTATGSLLRISDWTKSQTFKTLLGQSFFYFWSVSKKSFCYFRQLFVKVRFCILFSFLRRSVFNNRWESPSEATMMWLVLTNDRHISWETETEERSLEQLCYVFKISPKLISNSGQLFFDPKVTLLFKKAFYMTSRWIVMRLMTAKKYSGKQKWRSNLRKSTTKWPRIEQSFATWHFIGRHFSQVVAKNQLMQIYLEPNPEPFHFSNFSFRSGHRAVEATNHPSTVDRKKVVKWSILSTWVTRSAFRVSPATTLLSACRYTTPVQIWVRIPVA